MSARILLTALIGLLPAAASAEADAGRAGQIFDYASGARSLGMGRAFTAVTRDVSSVYENPAGLGLQEGRQLSLSRMNLYGGATVDHAAYSQNLRRLPGGWGVQLLRLAASGGLGRDEFNRESGGFGYSETALGFAYGTRGLLIPKLSLGLGGKMLSRSLGSSSDRFYGVDLGAQYGPIADDRLMLGLSLADAYSRSSGDTSDKLEPSARLGLSYRVADPLLLAAETGKPGSFRLGAEYAFSSLFLRAGFGEQGASFGAGLLFRKAFSLDIAIANSALGMAPRVTLGYRFGAKKPRQITGMASNYFGNAVAELARHHYAQASRDFERALAYDATVADSNWKRRIETLSVLVRDLRLEPGGGEEAELAAGEAGALAHRAVMARLDGQSGDAVLLAHVAAGTSMRQAMFVRLLEVLAKATGQSIVRDDIASASVFVQERLKRSLDSFHRRNYQLALSSSREALLVSPNDPMALTRLGSAYFALGQRSQAAEAYRKVLEIEPGNERLKEFLQKQGLLK